MPGYKQTGTQALDNLGSKGGVSKHRLGQGWGGGVRRPTHKTLCHAPPPSFILPASLYSRTPGEGQTITGIL